MLAQGKMLAIAHSLVLRLLKALLQQTLLHQMLLLLLRNLSQIAEACDAAIKVSEVVGASPRAALTQVAMHVANISSALTSVCSPSQCVPYQYSLTQVAMHVASVSVVIAE